MPSTAHLVTLMKALEISSNGSIKVNVNNEGADTMSFSGNNYTLAEYKSRFGHGHEITGVLEFLISKIDSLEREIQLNRMHMELLNRKFPPLAGIEYYEKSEKAENCPHKSSFVLKY